MGTENEILYDKLKLFDIEKDYLNDRIDKEDLDKLFNQNNIRTDIINIMFDQIDTNNDSFITINEYVSWKNALTLQYTDQILRKTQKNDKMARSIKDEEEKYPSSNVLS